MRQLQQAELDLLFAKLKSVNDVYNLYGITALINFQLHLIARIDDTCQVRLQNLKTHPQFPFALRTKLNWSKNVHDERDAPWQTILGSLESKYCVLASMALWLEVFSMKFAHSNNTPYLFAFSEDIRIPEGSDKSKSFVQRTITKHIKEDPNFGLGINTHSVRKMESTIVRRCGATKDEKYIRGRWKSR